jgi:PKHD-type hydroxylase
MKYNGIQNTTSDRAQITYPYTWWDNGFTEEELQWIINNCETADLHRGTVIDNIEKMSPDRKCDLAFYSRTTENAWVFDRMNMILNTINDQFYGFELNGYDSFQYTAYNSEELAEYDWHMDIILGKSAYNANMPEPRKLSMTILLNDDFEGGEFQVNLGNEKKPETVELPKGRAIIFPSWLIHRVKPVTKGIRRSVVVWTQGPKFS